MILVKSNSLNILVPNLTVLLLNILVILPKSQMSDFLMIMTILLVLEEMKNLLLFGNIIMMLSVKKKLMRSIVLFPKKLKKYKKKMMKEVTIMLLPNLIMDKLQVLYLNGIKLTLKKITESLIKTWLYLMFTDLDLFTIKMNVEVCVNI